MKHPSTAKRSLALFIGILLAVSLFSSSALAAGPKFDGGLTGAVSTACETQPTAWQMYRLELMVASANARIELYVRIAQSTPYDDVDWLLQMVDLTAAPVFAYAAQIGATVVCDAVPTVVDGQTVLIDPIRVIKH